MNKVVVLDTETTGLANHPLLGHPEVIELAQMEVLDSILTAYTDTEMTPMEIAAWVDVYIKVHRYLPEMSIHPDAYRIHGILAKDLRGMPKSSTCKLPADVEYIVGHNVTFDHRCLGKPDVKQICTMGLARSINKRHNLGLDSLKLDNLIRHFYPTIAYRLIQEKHAAASDVTKTVLLLARLCNLYLPKVTTFAALYDMQQLLKKLK